VAGWCWADLVARGAVPDRPVVPHIREPSSMRPRSRRTPSSKDKPQNNLSISPPGGQPGQVDRSVSGFANQHDTARNAVIEESPTARDDLSPAHGWLEAIARLDSTRPPADVPPRRWMQVVDDIRRFVDGGFAKKAAALGWTALDLFGCDREKPFARIDRQGLCWLISGNRLIELCENGATIETWTGARQTWRRKQNEPGRVLAWELTP
jgi:hypothetical protein